MGHDGTQWANRVVSLHGGYQSTCIIRLSWLRKQDAGAQRGPQIEVHSPVLYQVLARFIEQTAEKKGPFHFHADGRFIDRNSYYVASRRQPPLSFSATICYSFASISRLLRSSICSAISAAAIFAQPTRPTAVTDRHTPTTF